MHLDSSKELWNLIYKKYQTTLLTKGDTAEILGVSVSTLDRLKKDGLGPSYKKMPSLGKNGTVKYPISAVIEYILTNNIQTA